MVPFKSIPWFLTSQWEQGMESLRSVETVILIGYSFPLHDAVARYAVHIALAANTKAKAVNVDPKAADPAYQRTIEAILSRKPEFIPASWCHIDPYALDPWKGIKR